LTFIRAQARFAPSAENYPEIGTRVKVLVADGPPPIAHNERLVQLEKRLSEPTDGPEEPPEEETELTRALRAAERNGRDWVVIGDRYVLTAPKGCLDEAVVRSV
jgi:hypothetical protein